MGIRVFNEAGEQIDAFNDTLLLLAFGASGNRTYGSNIRMLPDARNVCAIQQIPLRKKVALKKLFLTGRHADLPGSPPFYRPTGRNILPLPPFSANGRRIGPASGAGFPRFDRTERTGDPGTKTDTMNPLNLKILILGALGLTYVVNLTLGLLNTRHKKPKSTTDLRALSTRRRIGSSFPTIRLRLALP